MIVTRLKLSNVGGVEDADFAFKEGVNLIVGVNGVGKTTALDALSRKRSSTATRVRASGI